MEQIFNYKNSAVTFQNEDGSIMVNATEMAKPFGKRPGKWMELTSTIEFMSELETIRKSDSLIVTAEGRNGGTWFHEDVAIEFARWLSPAFAIWCNDRIKELMTTGKTSIEKITRKELAQMLLEAEIKKEELELQLRITENQLKETEEVKEHFERITDYQKRELNSAAPKVTYFETVINSESAIATNIIANDLGMSAISLNQKLKALGVIYKQSGEWVLTQKYRGKDLVRTKTHTYTNSRGEQCTSVHMYWTEKGREMIHRLLNPKLQKANG